VFLNLLTDMKTFLTLPFILLVSTALFAQSSVKNITFTEHNNALFEKDLPKMAMVNTLIKEIFEEDKNTQKIKKLAVNRDSVYVLVDSPASFPGGQEALAKFISNNLVKPKGSHKNEKVLIRFVVERYGEITKVHVVEGESNTELSVEAIKVVRLMNFWTPAKLQGVDVSSYNTLAIGY
jgi:hypothetical protein